MGNDIHSEPTQCKDITIQVAWFPLTTIYCVPIFTPNLPW